MTPPSRFSQRTRPAWGGLGSIRGGSPVGLGHRIGWHYDTDTDSDVDASDRWYWFAHDDRWRIVATFRGTGASSTDTSPKEQFVFHAGGLNGTGGSSYIDSVILREKDDNSGWTSAADGTLEQRRYYLQNWRSDVSAMVEADGTQVERVKYSAYGVPIDLTPGDFNASATITSQDDTDFQAAQGGAYDVRADLNMDGNSDFSDYLAFLNEYGTGEAGGRGVLSRPSNANRAGYAGYQHAPELLGTKWHVRNRVLESELGRWQRRDPLGYIESANLSNYVLANPLAATDPAGLLTSCDPAGAAARAASIYYQQLLLQYGEQEAARMLACRFGVCIAALVTGFSEAWFEASIGQCKTGAGPIPIAPSLPIDATRPAVGCDPITFAILQTAFVTLCAASQAAGPCQWFDLDCEHLARQAAAHFSCRYAADLFNSTCFGGRNMHLDRTAQAAAEARIQCQEVYRINCLPCKDLTGSTSGDMAVPCNKVR